MSLVSTQERAHDHAARWVGNHQDAEDLLQNVFLKALRQGRRFCSVENGRAWLFQVARNALADGLRAPPPCLSTPA
jgi:RNA polymerase sigma-70 factor, ECF subfamily